MQFRSKGLLRRFAGCSNAFPVPSSSLQPRPFQRHHSRHAGVRKSHPHLTLARWRLIFDKVDTFVATESSSPLRKTYVSGVP